MTIARDETSPPKVVSFPRIRPLKEDNVRKGFLEIEAHLRLLKQCREVGPWMEGIYLTGYTFGFRSEEVLTIRVGQADMVNRCIRLDDTKNDDSRLAYMTAELYDTLLPLFADKAADAFLFTREDGTRVLDLRKSWWLACANADLGKMFCRDCDAVCTSASRCAECDSDNVGYDGLLFHDLRRTAIRNMVRRGVPEKWAMAISGHRTRAVFDRYDIINEDDLMDAARRMEAGERAELQRLGLRKGQRKGKVERSKCS